MKTILFTFLLFTNLAHSAYFTYKDVSQMEGKVLQDVTLKYFLRIEETTFNHNVLGYACPVPGIHLPISSFDAALNHTVEMFGNLGPLLHIQNPENKFCNFNVDKNELFGEEFEVGNTIEIKLRVVRKIIEENSKKYLAETVLTQIGPTKLMSTVDTPL